ncbi:MAG: hypothetical protein R2845_07095 [Thermomicrobiales bacterium]
MALHFPISTIAAGDDLVEEGLLIPFYAPEWTDHNAHDPGVTLLELFAWLAEWSYSNSTRFPTGSGELLAGGRDVEASRSRVAHARTSRYVASPASKPDSNFFGLDPFGSGECASAPCMDSMRSPVRSPRFKRRTAMSRAT